MVVQTALPEKQLQGNPLESHLRMFATSLMDRGYRKKTIQDKLYLLAKLGWWFRRNKLAISHLDEASYPLLSNRRGEFTPSICQLCVSSLITCENARSSPIARWFLSDHL